MSYTVTLKTSLFRKIIKNVKAHLFVPENPKMLMLVLDNEERIYVNLASYKNIHFSDGWFKMEAKRIEEESQGKAQI